MTLVGFVETVIGKAEAYDWDRFVSVGEGVLEIGYSIEML